MFCQKCSLHFPRLHEVVGTDNVADTEIMHSTLAFILTYFKKSKPYLYLGKSKSVSGSGDSLRRTLSATCFSFTLCLMSISSNVSLSSLVPSLYWEIHSCDTCTLPKDANPWGAKTALERRGDCLLPIYVTHHICPMSHRALMETGLRDHVSLPLPPM